MFTTNRVVGAPVTVCRDLVPADDLRAVVINSGNANACTGDKGLGDARAMIDQVAGELGCRNDQVLVCSTGIIGVHLPMEAITAGIPSAVSQADASDDSFRNAATAMMTTDTFAKQESITVELSGGTVRVSGAAKGAAMIAPNMATMLGVVMTDARLSAAECSALLKSAIDPTFNCISVDGHMSTSDTVFLLANASSEVVPADEDDLAKLQEGIRQVCEKLATDIIRDAEGGEHFIVVDVAGFETRELAYQTAKAVSESALVKTAIAGNDPNWGRITSAAGYAGIDFEPAFLSLKINGACVYQAGTPTDFDEAALSQQMKQNRDVHLELELSGGPASGSESVRFWTSDLTQEYVRLNSEYTT